MGNLLLSSFLITFNCTTIPNNTTTIIALPITTITINASPNFIATLPIITTTITACGLPSEELISKILDASFCFIFKEENMIVVFS